MLRWIFGGQCWKKRLTNQHIFSRARNDGVEVCNGEQVLNLNKSFKYLWSMIHKEGDVESHIKHHINVT